FRQLHHKKPRFRLQKHISTIYKSGQREFSRTKSDISKAKSQSGYGSSVKIRGLLTES
ncbi:9465_t:CDS:1, partial [Gigaspora margarita]